MSIEAITWALRDAPDVPGHLVSTLLVYAYRADKTGTGSHPSLPTIADWTRRSEAVAKRNVRELVKLGLIRPGDQTRASYIRADRRPVVYDLAIERIRTSNTDEPNSHGGSPTTPRNLFDELDEGSPTTPREAVTRDRPRPPAESGQTPHGGSLEYLTGGRPRPPKEVLKEKPLPLSRSRLIQAVIDATGWEEEEARGAIQKIKIERKPTALSRYITALIESGDIDQFGPTQQNGHNPAPDPANITNHPYTPDPSGQACGHPGCGRPAKRHAIRPITQGAPA